MSKKTEAIESFLVSGNGRSRSVVANGGSSPQTGATAPYPSQIYWILISYPYRKRL